VELVDRNAEDLVALERAVLERVGLVAGLVQVAGAEGVGVDNQDAAGLEVLEVGLQRRGVHRDQGVERVARGVDLVAAEADLETRNTGERAGGRTDLGGESGPPAGVRGGGGRGGPRLCGRRPSR